ncbi:MAG: hypothetical protein LBF91_01550 [Azoarcus sp.]|nr:hypothetical protein [Azoarcus sp.]
MPIFLPRFLAALWLAFLLGGVLSGNANPLPITRGVSRRSRMNPTRTCWASASYSASLRGPW